MGSNNDLLHFSQDDVFDFRLIRPEDWVEIPYITKETREAFIRMGKAGIEDVFPYWVDPEGKQVITDKHLIFEMAVDAESTLFESQTKLLVEEWEPDFIPGGVYVILANDELLIRRVKDYQQVIEGTLMLCNGHSQNTEIIVRKDAVERIWKVLASFVWIN
ncbi:hypothetical protein GCM10027299_09130 [Larkinella ripae]